MIKKTFLTHFKGNRSKSTNSCKIRGNCWIWTNPGKTLKNEKMYFLEKNTGPYRNSGKFEGHFQKMIKSTFLTISTEIGWIQQIYVKSGEMMKILDCDRFYLDLLNLNKSWKNFKKWKNVFFGKKPLDHIVI